MYVCQDSRHHAMRSVHRCFAIIATRKPVEITRIYGKDTAFSVFFQI